MTENTPPDAQNRTLRDAHAILHQLPILCLNLAQGHIDGPTRAARPTRHATPQPPVNLERVVALDTNQRIRTLDHHHELWANGEPRQGILPTLWLWATMLEADWLDQSPELPAELPDHPTIASVCAWLTTHDHLWDGQPEWDEYAADLDRLDRWAKRLTRWAPDPHCPTCGAPFVRHGDHIWRCTGCNTEISTRVTTVSLTTAHALTGVPERTLRDWAKRQGLLTPQLDNTGQPLRDRHSAKLYDLDQIRRLADEHRARRMA